MRVFCRRLTEKMGIRMWKKCGKHRYGVVKKYVKMAIKSALNGKKCEKCDLCHKIIKKSVNFYLKSKK